ncbi:uncharacterized protein MONBRDRAFT_29407 [Monosiga brevicollis MX1]|uniref:SET domain-containing protein n=1 Tax=Monosiga brevicollis TaxID=81824 RepID=A9VB00_MONBE|nr:uncharacterized protein MONBRDRAFT_29407 [Monosiga brevicollis MX1]EDQ85305.1 predicted protein [Monosiga brevicollis MX1]|eukprot:XP_001749926.1 hypothetical protein [Monosiga brevicollis MX1]
MALGAGVALCETAELGRFLQAKTTLDAGAIVCASRGLCFHHDREATTDILDMLFQTTPAGTAKREALSHQITDLCPRASDDVDVLKAALGHATRALDLNDAVLERVHTKLGQNCFDQGFFPDASLLNHSCQPNCGVFVPDREGGQWRTMEVRATRAIATGEMLTISYLEGSRLMLPVDQRQRHLQAAYA